MQSLLLNSIQSLEDYCKNGSFQNFMRLFGVTKLKNVVSKLKTNNGAFIVKDVTDVFAAVVQNMRKLLTQTNKLIKYKKD